ncbi:MAG: chorismate mutase [Actinomycetota bacterium]|nr:chorismate mutase [Actinomycetota bacterium]
MSAEHRDADAATDHAAEAQAELAAIRLSIDNIDAALVHMLAERFKFTQKVGRLKAASGMPASDPERERVQIARLRAIAMQAQLDPAFAEKWFNFVVAEVIHHHEQLATGAIGVSTSSTTEGQR